MHVARPHLSPAEIRDTGLDVLRRRVGRQLDADVFQRDPDYICEHLPTVQRVLTTYFAPEVRGVERLPDEGPFLLLSNHSGGLLMPDAWALGTQLLARFGTERPIYGLMLDFAFTIPGFGTALRKFGALPASPEHAEQALSLDAGVLVYPGGDWEAYRPWAERNRIEFRDHVGFVRLALRRQVPVFPVVSHGSHESLIVVSRGDRLARVLGLDRLRINVFPIVLGIPFGIGPVFVPNVPLPAKVLVEVLEPREWGHLGRDAAHDPGVVRACYEEITTRMQQALDGLVREMPHPVWRRQLGAVGLAGPAGLGTDSAPMEGDGHDQHQEVTDCDKGRVSSCSTYVAPAAGEA
jgi:1-acyl-sn-glycerol-3-phosphate acyltransferase